jgi:hypothetical protein
MALKTRWTGLASLALVLGCGSDSTGPTISTLQNDDFTSGGSPTFQAGFVTGEAAAARLGPQSAAFTVRKVRFLFGGATTTKTVTLTIYQDGDSTNPGAVLHSADYSLTGSNSAFQEIDLTGQNIHVAATQKIRVAILFQHDGAPSVAIDGARTASRNFIYSGGWITTESVSLNGDFIIRAEISTP